jgi:FtsZ-interacting cell division protein YlmF
MYLDDATEGDRRRLTDFASGMVYVAGGTMQRIETQRFRLTNPTPIGGPWAERHRDRRGP